MDPLPLVTNAQGAGTIAIVGAGPSGLVLAIALARQGLRSTVFERDAHPSVAPRFNPDRSYTIDISGHGLRALRYIDACDFFDERLLRFKGLKLGRETVEWTLPGWTGARGDILRALMWVADERHPDDIAFEFECRVNAVDVVAGTLTTTRKSGATVTENFDLIVGADGAGSVVRNAMVKQIEGFTVSTKSLPNFCTMLELDHVAGRLDPHYLHGLSLRPFCVAGAIRGEGSPDAARWFCTVGTRSELAFASPEEAVRFFRERAPMVLEFASEEAIAAFSRRPCHHIGQELTCSQLHGGKAALLGDAAAPFPPIGQGVNAAMESAMALDECIEEVGASPEKLLEAAALFNTRWKPEADAVSWISERSLFENRFHILRARVASKVHMSVLDEAKSADHSYADVRHKAEHRWPLWA